MTHISKTTNESSCSNPAPFIAGGVLTGSAMIIAGIFLILAVYQVLPHGVNVISHLGQLGKGIAFTSLMVGGEVLIGVIIASIEIHYQREEKPVEEKLEEALPEEKPVEKSGSVEMIPLQKMSPTETLFFRAMVEGDLVKIKKLIDEHPELASKTNIYQQTPLEFADTLWLEVDNSLKAQYLEVYEFFNEKNQKSYFQTFFPTQTEFELRKFVDD